MMEACSAIDTTTPMPRNDRGDRQVIYPASIALVPRELPFFMQNQKERAPIYVHVHAGQEIYHYSVLHRCSRVARKVNVQDIEPAFFNMMASHILQLEATQQAAVTPLVM
jgi:hypothetical protein